MNGRWRILSAACLFFLLGCGGNEERKPKLHFPLVFGVQTDKTSYQRGELIEVTFTVTNAGQQKIDLQLLAVPFDIKVFDKKTGQTIWHLKEAFPFEAGILYFLSLSPKSTRAFHEEWDQRLLDGSLVPSGEYFIKAWLRPVFIDKTNFEPKDQEALLFAISLPFTIKE